jgi:hypothetical protein
MADDRSSQVPPAEPEHQQAAAAAQPKAAVTAAGTESGGAADAPAAAVAAVASPAVADEGLQLDRFEPAPGHGDVEGGLICHYCKHPLSGQFWELNGHPSCESCQLALSRHFSAPLPWSLWGRVTLYGGGAALLGTLIYFAVLKITGYELGLIAIVVGLLVGGAVRRASGFRGGWKLQAAAMAFTYASIVSAYIPSVYEGFKKAGQEDAQKNVQKDAQKNAASPAGAGAATPAAPTGNASGTSPPAADPSKPPSPNPQTAAAAGGGPAVAAASAEPASDQRTLREMGLGSLLLNLLLAGLVLFLFSAAAPILAGFQNFMGWIIIGFALYEAWKLNRRPNLVIRGPLPMTAPAAADSPPAAG